MVQQVLKEPVVHQEVQLQVHKELKVLQEQLEKMDHKVHRVHKDLHQI
jgi:hypothetical protein